MNKKTCKKRLTALFLSVMMAFQNISVMAFAENDGSLRNKNSDNTASAEYDEERTDTKSGPVKNTFDRLYFEDELLEEMDFSNKRLLAGTDDKSVFTEDTNIISDYNGVYLLGFDSEYETMSAYTYYYDMVDFVEPDIDLFVGGDGNGKKSGSGTDPLSRLHALRDQSLDEESAQYDIAVIDTGASLDIDGAVSVIGEDPRDDNGHAKNTIKAVKSVSSDLSVLSIKAFDTNGRGSVSSVYAAIVYAVDQGADVIDLSFATKSVSGSRLLDRAAGLAAAEGVVIVGSAGDDGADASGYIPGRTAGVYIAGACDKSGSRLSGSNYGRDVFCNVNAASSDEAAAKLSAVMAKYGPEKAFSSKNSGLVFKNDYLNEETEPTEEIGLIPELSEDEIKKLIADSEKLMDKEEKNDEEEEIKDDDEAAAESAAEASSESDEVTTAEHDKIAAIENDDAAEIENDEPAAVENDEAEALDDSDGGGDTNDGNTSVGGVSVAATIKWLTKSDVSGGSESLLKLRPETDELSDQQFQIDFDLAGQSSYEPGTIELTIPAYIWKNRDDKNYGTLTLAIPEDPTKGTEFAWRLDGDKIIITNTKKIAAASSVMIQGTFRNMKATEMVDEAKSADLFVTLSVKTPSGSYASVTTKPITAQIDTFVDVESADKSAFNYIEGYDNVFWDVPENMPADLPAEFLPANSGEYVYVRWYAAGTVKGSQPFRLYLTDTISGDHGGMILGVTNCAEEGGIKAADEDHKITALLFDGYSTVTKTAYVWTAYKKDTFTEDVIASLENNIEIKAVGWDHDTAKDDPEDSEDSEEKSATAATKKPTTYTFVKKWNDNSNEKGHRPSRIILNIYRQEYSDTEPYYVIRYLGDDQNDAKLDDDDDTWEYTWSDNGHESHFFVGEEIERDQVQGDEMSRFNDKVYKLHWYYELDKQTPDPNDSTKFRSAKRWEFENKYYERWLAETISGITKTNRSPFNDPKIESMRDMLSLNRLANGEQVDVTYDINATVSTAKAYLSQAKKHRYTFEDSNYSFNNNRELTDKDLSFRSITVSEAAAYEYFGDPQPNPVTGDPTYNSQRIAEQSDVILKGKIENTWVELARLTYKGQNGSWSTERSDVSIEEINRNHIFLPEKVTGIKLETEAEAAYVQFRCAVELRINPTDAVKEMINASFNDNSEGSYFLYNLYNSAGISAEYLGEDTTIEGDAYNKGNIPAESKKDNSSYAYLHGRPFNVAAELTKSFVVQDRTDDDKQNGILRVHSALELSQQSGIVEAERSYYDMALANGFMLNTKSGTFYDLLPYGFEPDLSTVEITSGGTVTNRWMIKDYKGSNRTLLVVQADLSDNVTYTEPHYPDPNNPTVKESKLHKNDETYPIEGYRNSHTLEFDSYVDLAAVLDQNPGSSDRVLKKVRNLAAFEADEGKIGSIEGWRGESDDPKGVDGVWQNKTTETAFSDEHDKRADEMDWMTDLSDKDEASDRSFVYAGAEMTYSTIDDSDMADLEKRVQAAGSGIWSKGLVSGGYSPVNVQESGLYTYAMTVNANEQDSNISNIILVDVLEDYKPDQYKDNEEFKDEEGKGDVQWKGTLISVDTTLAEELGAEPVVYYCLSSVNFDEYTSEDAVDPNSIGALLEKKGGIWKTDEEMDPGDMAKVKAIAVDLRYSDRANKIPFTLMDGKTISVYVDMRAPFDKDNYPDPPAYFWDEEAKEFTDGTDPDKNGHAYNKVHMIYTTIDKDTHLSSNYTKVGIYSKSVIVQKIWEDEDDRDGVRPKEITVSLYDDKGNLYGTKTLSEETHWMAAFDRLPTYYDDGTTIVYRYEETCIVQLEGDDKPVEHPLSDLGYTLTTERIVDKSGAMSIRLTNTRPPELINIPVTKNWDDVGNTNARPLYIVARLYANGQYTGKSITLRPNADGEWLGVFNNVYKYDDHGKPIRYTIREDPIQDYVYDGEDWADSNDASQGVIINNRYDPHGDLKISKAVENTNEMSEDKVFTFELELWIGVNTPFTENNYTYTIYDKNGKVLDENDLPLTGTVYNGCEIQLKGGQWAYIEGLPTSVTINGQRQAIHYRVTERNENSGFTMTDCNAAEGVIQSWTAVDAHFVNTYMTEGWVQLQAEKELNGRDLEQYDFSFGLYGEDDLNEPIRTSYNDGRGKVAFGRITYGASDHGKTYTYYIKEILPAGVEDKEKDGEIYKYKDGIYYDTNTYMVEVSVSDDGMGHMTCTPTYYLVDDDLNKISPLGDKCPLFENTYEASGSIDLRAWKSIDGGTVNENTKFKFDLYEHGENNKIVLRMGNVENTDVGIIDFTGITFDQDSIGKTYWFYAREQKGSDDTYIYSNEVIGFEVTVIDNGDGTLSFNQTSYIMTDAFDPCSSCKGESVDSECSECGGFGYIIADEAKYKNWIANKPNTSQLPNITNGQADGSLSITKEITGADSSDDEFIFTLTLIGDKIEEHKPTGYVRTGEGIVGEEKVTLTEAPDGSYTITLKGGQTATITGLPAGTTYQIVENVSGQWILKDQVNASGTIPPADTAEAEFTNEFQPDSTSASIVGFKFFDGKPIDESKAGQFEFVLLTDKDDLTTELDRTSAPIGGLFRFKPIIYTNKPGESATGTFTYWVREVKGSDTKVNYDSSVIKVVVTVTDNDGVLDADVKYYNADGSEISGAMRFDNSTVLESLRINKRAFGVNEYNKDAKFKFHISFTDKNGMPLSERNVTYFIRDKDGTLLDKDGNPVEEKELKTGESEIRAVTMPLRNSSAAAAAEEKELGQVVQAVSNGTQEYPVMPMAVPADAKDWGISKDPSIEGDDGVLWSITPEPGSTNRYVLRLEPANGEEGTLENHTLSYNSRLGSNGYGWQQTSKVSLDQIKTVIIEKGVNANPGHNKAMFRNLGVEKADLSGLYASEATGSFIYMFGACKSLNTVTFGDMQICKSNEVSYMFDGCSSLKTINGISDLINFEENTHALVDMECIFTSCKELTAIDVSGWNINLKNGSVDTKQMFSGCSGLTEITGTDIFKNTHINSCSQMFSNCSKLTSLDVSEWNLTLLGKDAYAQGNCSMMFSGCTALEEINASGWITSSTTAKNPAESLFTGCNPKILDVSGWSPKTSSISLYDANLSGMTKLEKITADENFLQYIKDSSFANHSAVAYKYTTNWVNINQIGKAGEANYRTFTPTTLVTEIKSQSSAQTYVWEPAYYRYIFKDGKLHEDDIVFGKMPSERWSYNLSGEELVIYNSYTLQDREGNVYIFLGWKDEANNKEFKVGTNGSVVIPANTYDHKADYTTDSDPIDESKGIVLKAMWQKVDKTKVRWIYADILVQSVDDENVYTYWDTRRFPVTDGQDTISINPGLIDGFMSVETKTVNVADYLKPDAKLEFRYDRIRYTIVFDGNGAPGEQYQKKMAAGVDAMLENYFVWENHAFIEWNTDPDGSGDSYSAFTKQSIKNITESDHGSTIVLYAKWLTIDSMGEDLDPMGDVYVTIKEGQTIVFPWLPVDTQYTIEEVELPDGWLRIEDERGLVISGTMEQNDTNVINETVCNRYVARGSANIRARKRFIGDTLTADSFRFMLSSNQNFNEMEEINKKITQTKTNADGDYDDLVTVKGAVGLTVVISGITPDEGTDDGVICVYGSEDDSVKLAELKPDSVSGGSVTLNVTGDIVRIVAHHATCEATVTQAKYVLIIGENGIPSDDPDAIASVAFDAVEFAKPGVYTFYIREIEDEFNGKKDNSGNIIYDSHVETVTVTVEDDGTGTGRLRSEVEYSSPKNPDYPKEDALFINRIATRELNVYKTLTNAKGTAADRQFTFNISLKTPSGDPLNGEFEAEIIWEEDGVSMSRPVKLKVQNGSGSFKLRGGERYKVLLPNGTEYEITEVLAPDGPFSQTYAEGTNGVISADKSSEALFTNNYTASGSVTLECTKELIGGTLTDNMFRFGLYQNGITFITDTYAASDGTVTFDIDYNIEDIAELPATFSYTIREEIPASDKSVRYDTHDVKVTVTVDDDNGQLVFTTQYDGDEDNTIFTNIAMYELEVSKNVENAPNLSDDEFEFILTLTEGEYELDTEITYTKYLRTAEVETASFELVDGKFGFTLKNGDKIIFEGLPYGTKYKIEEKESSRYVLKSIEVTGDDGAEIDSRIINGSIGEGKVTVGYLNSIILSLPSAGGRGTVMFYTTGVLLMLFAAFLFERRRAQQKNVSD